MNQDVSVAPASRIGEANPVYKGYFADPFVLAHEGQYYAYGTGASANGKVFQVLRSADLAHWTPLGTALETLAEEPLDYWAPEVAFDGDTFYMYYSVGQGDQGHTLRVASADVP